MAVVAAGLAIIVAAFRVEAARMGGRGVAGYPGPARGEQKDHQEQAHLQNPPDAIRHGQLCALAGPSQTSGEI